MLSVVLDEEGKNETNKNTKSNFKADFVKVEKGSHKSGSRFYNEIARAT